MVAETQNFSAWMRAADIQASISRCREIFNSGVFNDGNKAGVLFESAVTHLLIHLNDLLQKANIDKRRISFVEDVEVTDSVTDVTDLVRACRNAACHVTSGEHKIDAGKFTFCVAAGVGPKHFVINGKEMGCEYSDDIAIYYGVNRLYIRRHLLRSFEAVLVMYDNPESRW
ncbi:hypothetical protein RYB01_17880 [Pseudomonas syringae]|nr:hypothetical protein [Pseudomonas syringae]